MTLRNNPLVLLYGMIQLRVIQLCNAVGYLASMRTVPHVREHTRTLGKAQVTRGRCKIHGKLERWPRETLMEESNVHHRNVWSRRLH